MSLSLSQSAAPQPFTNGVEAGAESVVVAPSEPLSLTRSLYDARERVDADDAGKWDSVVRCQEICLHQGRIVFPEAQDAGYETGLELTAWALSQAAQRLGIPVGYLKHCPPHLQDANVNYWLQSLVAGHRFTHEDTTEAEWLLRMKGGAVRAVLSPRYTKLDNARLLDILLPLLSGSRYQVGLIHLSSEALHLRLIEPGIGREVLPKDRLLVAVHVANSEVGLRAVTVDACVYRVVCSNGLLRRLNNKSLLKQRHIHVAEPRFQQMLEAAIQEAVVVAAGFIEQMALAVKTSVPNPEAAVETLAKAWNLPKQTVEWVKFSLFGEPQPGTLYSLVNAVTQAAQRLGMEDRFELEMLASLLVDTNPATKAEHDLRQRILSGAK